MTRLRSIRSLPLLILTAALSLVAVGHPALAQEGGPIKTQATLAGPEGTTSAVTGRAKATYQVKQKGTSEKLFVTLQHLERKTDYRVVVDGIELGVFSPKGNSGTLKLQLRRPAKGNQSAIPDAVPSVGELLVIDVYAAVSGELVATGAFAPLQDE